jgi:hypothetical protein
MENFTLGLTIPLISYPQAGGKLRMVFSIAYSTPILVPNGSQQCNIAGTCFPIDVSYRILNPGISVVPHFVPQVVPNYFQPTGAEEPELQDYSVIDPGGANHHLGQTGTNTLNTWIARDASDYAINVGRHARETLPQAAAIRYASSRWQALTRYVDDGQLEIDNNAAERALRVVAWRRKNISSADRTRAGNAPPPSTRCSDQPSSTVSIRNSITIKCAFHESCTSANPPLSLKMVLELRQPCYLDRTGEIMLSCDVKGGNKIPFVLKKCVQLYIRRNAFDKFRADISLRASGSPQAAINLRITIFKLKLFLRIKPIG